MIDNLDLLLAVRTTSLIVGAMFLITWFFTLKHTFLLILGLFLFGVCFKIDTEIPKDFNRSKRDLIEELDELREENKVLRDTIEKGYKINYES